MSEMTFVVGGRIVSAGEVRMIQEAQARPKMKRTGPDEYHRGWIVEGFRPGHIAEAKRVADYELACWRAMSADEQAAAMKDGLRQPKPWSEEAFVRRVKRQKMRGKPYEVENAAAQCAEMARNGGWEHVRVVELKKVKGE